MADLFRKSYNVILETSANAVDILDILLNLFKQNIAVITLHSRVPEKKLKGFSFS